MDSPAEPSPLHPFAMLRGTSSAAPPRNPSANRAESYAGPDRDLSQAYASNLPNQVMPEVQLEEFQAIPVLGETDCPDNPRPRRKLKTKGTPAFQIRRLVQRDIWGRFRPDVKTVSGRSHKNLSRGLAWANRLCPDPRTQSRAGSARGGSRRPQAGAGLVLLREPQRAKNRHRTVHATRGGGNPSPNRLVRCARQSSQHRIP